MAPLFRKHNTCEFGLISYSVYLILMIGIIQQEATIMSVIVKDIWAVKDFLEAMIILKLAM